MTQRLVIVEHEPCPEWDEMDDTGYCRNCGGQLISHEPYLSRAFDYLAALDGRAVQ